MGQPVVHFEVIGRDGPALRSFYGELFGWKAKEVGPPMDYGMVDASEAGIGGGIGASQEFEGHVTFYVQVPDLQAALEKAESLGGATRMPPSEVGEGTTIAQLTDPEGHMIGLVQG
jgi:predicted enzyme related to lactoylglutathione lyase